MNAPKDGGDKKGAPAKGKWVLEIYITGEKDKKEITKCYRIELDNEDCIKKYGVDAEEYLEGTAIIAAVKLMSKDKWKKPGVFTTDEFDPDPYMEMLNEYGLPWVVEENPTLID